MLAAVIIAALIPSCGDSQSATEPGYTQLSADELREIAQPLIEQSYEINEIFFRKGLPVEEDLKELYAADTQINGEAPDYSGYDVKYSDYYVVSFDCGYESCNDIREAALKVYTADYCESAVFPAAFSGITSDSGEIYEYAKYIDNTDLLLSVRADLANGAIDCSRRYDFETFEIIRQSEDGVYFTLVSSDGLTVELCIKKTAEGWRLDYPTY